MIKIKNIEVSEEDLREAIKANPQLLKPEVDYKAFRAEQGGRYSFVNVYGTACFTTEEACDEDDYRYLTGNYYEFVSDCKKALAYNLALGRVTHAIIEANAGWVADWKNKDENKWIICYSRISIKLHLSCTTWSDCGSVLQSIKSEEIADQIIAEHKDDLIVILGK